jgi:dolichol-phosphate mannosyltransferase
MNIGTLDSPKYSLVIPVFNEQAVIPLLLRRLDHLLEKLDGPAEVIFVDDGGRDAGGIMLADRARHDARYRYVALSRNFGHQIAVTAGLDLARGEAVVVMDADLQDPPEVVLALIAKWNEGYEVVHARRRARAGESRFKRITAGAFYRALRALSDVDIPADVGDFRLIDRGALDTFRAMRERDRFVRGMFGWIGYRQTIVDFEREARAGGRTKYSLPRMVRLALDGIIGFSDVPLRLALWLGAAVSLGALCYGGYVLVLALADVNLVSGWASLSVLVALLSGINLLMTGIVGLYVGRIHHEVKGRPLYVVARTIGAADAGVDRQPAREAARA